MRNEIGTTGASPRRCEPDRTHGERPGRPIPCWATGLLLLTLLPWLTACGKTEIIRQTEYVIPPPPVGLLAPTEIPPYSGTTNGDLEDYAHVTRASIQACNADKRAALAAWPIIPDAPGAD